MQLSRFSVGCFFYINSFLDMTPQCICHTIFILCLAYSRDIIIVEGINKY